VKTEISNNGELYNQTIYKNEKNRKRFGQTGDKFISLGKFKNQDKFMPVTDYGGYTSEKPAYFVILKFNDKKYKMVSVPVLKTINNFNLLNYIKEQYGEKAKYLLTIPKYQFIEDKNGKFIISGINDKYLATQFVVSRKDKEINEFLYHIYTSWGNYNPIEKGESQEDYINRNFLKFKKIFLLHLDAVYPKNETYNTIIRVLNKTDNYTTEQKCDLIKGLLIITHCNAMRANLVPFGASKEVGRIMYATKLQDASIIYNSVTGIYHKKVKITDIEG